MRTMPWLGQLSLLPSINEGDESPSQTPEIHDLQLTPILSGPKLYQEKPNSPNNKPSRSTIED